MRATYTGSCHCGAVGFEAEIDLAEPTYRCNCSICARTRFWPTIVAPDRFRLLRGEEELTEYRFNSMRNSHHFCRRCGVRTHGIGVMGDGSRIFGVNIGCLEGVATEMLAAAPIVYVDGAHDRFEAPPVTAYL